MNQNAQLLAQTSTSTGSGWRSRDRPHCRTRATMAGEARAAQRGWAAPPRRVSAAKAALATATALLLAAPGAEGTVVACAMLPHGDFAYDPSLVHGANGSSQVHYAAVEAGKRVAAAKPDLVFITTPHGVALDNDFAVFSNSNGSGFALVGQDLHNASFHSYKVPLSVRMDPTEAAAVVAAAGGAAGNTTGLQAWADSEPTPLRWGEIIPLTFLRSLVAPVGGAPAASVIVLSVPLRRHTQDVAMVPELLELGRNLARHFDASDKRVAVVVSADLAHTHLASGPYGFSPAAEPFDEACGRWAGTLNATALLVEAAALVDRALSCGWTGMVMLHGLLAQLGGSADVDSGAGAGRGGDGDAVGGAVGRRLVPQLLAIAHPTYYGMLVATYLPPGIVG